MGGFGSGRKPSACRPLVETAFRVDLRPLFAAARSGRFGGSIRPLPPHGDAFVVCVADFERQRLDLDAAINGEIVSATLALDASRLPWGGLRWYVLCPREGCEARRRAEIIYVTPRGWACRRCASVVYACRTLDRPARAGRRAARIRARLGAARPEAVLEAPPPRPRWMHRTTYERVLRETAEKATEWAAALPARQTQLVALASRLDVPHALLDADAAADRERREDDRPSDRAAGQRALRRVA